MRKHVVFISLPMSGIPEETIKEHIQEAKAWYLSHSSMDIRDVSFVHNLGCINAEDIEAVLHKPLWYLGWAITGMSGADVVLFYHGWEDARGCRIEYAVCEEYRIPTLDMDEED